MQIIAKKALKTFWARHNQAEAPLTAWYLAVDKAIWTGPADVKATFGTSVDFVADNRIVFNIAGNKYRLVVHVAYPFKRVLIKFVGTPCGVRQDQRGEGVMKNIRPIKTEEDYDWAIAEITRYFDNQPEVGSPDGDRFDVLATLIEAYENNRYPITAPDPVAAISAYMAMAGLKQVSLADVLGSRSRASEILSRKRPLTMDMIHKIHEQWHIPAEVLIKPYHLAGDGEKKRRA